ncbi:hypothetical protein [Streptomyces sp. NPDC093071]|uniref:hypothetical protein n=1 Tax=Streptomyces sp. NPDC093071 TaxID=3366022 RepID=UPI00381073B2
MDEEPEAALAVVELVDDHRDEEGHREAEDRREHGEQGGVAPRPPEGRAVDDRVQVVEADPGGAAVLGLPEDEEELPDHRVLRHLSCPNRNI